MNIDQSGACKDHNCGVKCLSWTAVITGAVIAIGLSFLGNLLMAALGLTAYTTSSEGVKNLAIGGFFAMAIGVMIVFFIAGWVSGALGRMNNCVNCNLGVIYGFTTWSLALIFSVLLASSIGQFMATQYEAVASPTNITLRTAQQTSATTVTTAQTAQSVTNKTTEVSKVNDEAAAKALGKTLLLVFLLFLVGAIMSCFGGYVGMKHCKKEYS